MRPLFFILCIFLSYTLPAFAGLPSLKIALVEDGPSLRYDGSEILKAEITDLLSDEFKLSFPEELHFSGNWELSSIKRELDLALNSKADILITLGAISSHLLAHKKELLKPSIAAVIIDADLQGLPEKEGTSGVFNLNYIDSFKSFARDLKAFRQILPFKHISVIGDKSLAEGVEELEQRMRFFAETMDLKLEFIPACDKASELLSRIPYHSEAVLLTPLLRFSDKEFDILLQGLIERSLPGFSLWGREEVERGVFAAMAPSGRMERLARRVALHVQQILMGRNAADLPVSFYQDEDFTINMETARSISIYPDRDLLLNADILYEDQPSSVFLSIEEAVSEALQANLDLRLAEYEELLALAEKKERSSPLKPQALVKLGGLIVDKDNAASSLGRQAERELKLELLLRQAIFIEKERSGADLAKLEEEISFFFRRRVELDIAEAAARAFLDLLSAKSLARIKKDDLELTRANLKRAENRRETGFAGPAELYRWQSRLAFARKDLLEAKSTLKQAEIGMNKILNRPLDQAVYPKDTELSDSHFFVSDSRMLWFSDNPRRIKHFYDFIVNESKDQAPELKSLNLAINAAERSLLAAKRAYYLPDIWLEGGLYQKLISDGEGSSAKSFSLMPGMPDLVLPEGEDFGWRMGLNFSYPLFSGGLRPALHDKALIQLESLRTQRLKLAERLEAGIRASLNKTSSSWPAISLAADALNAAEKNLDLVTDAYERGMLSVTDLLDAQHAAMVAEQLSVSSVYDFLKDLMAVQRFLGNVDFSASLEDRNAMFKRLEAYFESLGIFLP